ncbi:SRPBCC domain-containing protein [Corynebacterium sp.]|uniref:SRPBCC domain-containing protein n=1 Tax=Corynebacterium sp. TaxID=1720 RepID=UPI0026498775|nr:SRPBCC domain-containing protein [Corynebacterium sp.]MDN6137879.1 SRPBCC domain-containing protein [Corynebacterium sp.]
MSATESLNETYRALGNAPVADGEGKSVVLRRTYAAEVTDAWKSCTDKEQLAQWFSEVDGDFRQGGSFQVKDNAGGEVLHCEAPITLKTTWALGPGMTTELELRFTPEGENTTLELEHSTPAEVLDQMVAAYGPGGTIGVAVGWELTLHMLGKHLSGEAFDPVTWESTDEAKEYAKGASEAWGEVVQKAWGTSDDDIAAAVAFANSHFASEEE